MPSQDNIPASHLPDLVGLGFPSLGSRVSCEGTRGSVCYVGAVEGTKGLWVGVEWDDPSRGKHDGSYNGRRYFVTRLPTAGSFVRREKLDLGVSIEDAIRDHYAPPETETVLPEHEREEVRKALKTKLFEVVGMHNVYKKQKNLATLEVITLIGKSINGGRLAAVAPHARQVMLAENLIPSWSVVCEMLAGCDKLTALGLSSNRLSFPVPTNMSFPSVSTLKLGDCAMTWAEISQVVLSLFPGLTSLFIPHNRVDGPTELAFPLTHSLPKITYLDLEGNRITSWEQVAVLSQAMPNLKTLNLNSVRLREISVADVRVSQLAQLTQLFISGNEFDLDSLSALAELPGLREILVASFKADEVIARLPQVGVVSRSDVSREDRRGAELDFLKRYFPLLPDVSEPVVQRLQQLVSKYGAPEEAETRPVVREPLQKNTLVLNVEGVGRPLRVPCDMLVERVRGLVSRLVKQDCDRLVVRSKRDPSICIPLNNDVRELRFFDVEEGDTIVWNGSL